LSWSACFGWSQFYGGGSENPIAPTGFENIGQGAYMPPSLIIRGDARHIPLADESVQCVITSPPYWGLRDYKLGPDAIGLEPTPELYVQHIVEIFREVKRVLRKDGTCWVNMGDGYASQGGPLKYDINSILGGKSEVQDYQRSRSSPDGLKPKDLIGMPWRVALALQADGWWLRSDIIWAKPNPMPESVTDRPTKAHEYLFLLTKSEKYYWDQEAVREPTTTIPHPLVTSYKPGSASSMNSGEHQVKTIGGVPFDSSAGRNIRTVWTIATQPFPDAHFATFPEKLVEPCVLAGTSERGCCEECGAPWDRIVQSEQRLLQKTNNASKLTSNPDSGWDHSRWPRTSKETETIGWKEPCHKSKAMPCLVLDPFAGSGTVGVVCARLNRRFVGIELSEEYCQIAVKRIAPYAAQAHLPLGG